MDNHMGYLERYAMLSVVLLPRLIVSRLFTKSPTSLWLAFIQN